jgi:DNA-binding HxlR family transcriptional regulator
MRSYGEYCALAKALDVVGERWTLLIVRELALRGACRYTDLRNGLPGIASNLLAARLRELEKAGLISREDAPPPVATSLFRLTPRGQQLKPILDDLMRWGLPLMNEQPAEDAVQSHWLARALQLMLTDHHPNAPPITLELRTGDQPIVVETGEGTVHARLGSADGAAATLTGAPRPIMGLLLGFIDLAEAEESGVDYNGDPAILERIRADTTSLTPAVDP